jgi:hypothetical protein
MPSDYHALYTPHSYLTQDQSRLSNQQAVRALQWLGVPELRVEGSHCTKLNSAIVVCVFLLLAFWSTLISCGGGSGGSGRGVIGSNAPTVDDSATGGHRAINILVCFGVQKSILADGSDQNFSKM